MGWPILFIVFLMWLPLMWSALQTKPSHLSTYLYPSQLNSTQLKLIELIFNIQYFFTLEHGGPDPKGTEA
jgi:hypothetical protein